MQAHHLPQLVFNYVEHHLFPYYPRLQCPWDPFSAHFGRAQCSGEPVQWPQQHFTILSHVSENHQRFSQPTRGVPPHAVFATEEPAAKKWAKETTDVTVSVIYSPYSIWIYVEGALTGSSVFTSRRTASKQADFMDWPVYYHRSDFAHFKFHYQWSAHLGWYLEASLYYYYILIVYQLWKHSVYYISFFLT